MCMFGSWMHRLCGGGEAAYVEVMVQDMYVVVAELDMRWERLKYSLHSSADIGARAELGNI